MPKPTPKPKPNSLDTHGVDARVYRQIDRVLDDLEDEKLPIGPKERVAALYTISRIRVLFNNLAKGSRDVDAGSSVRKYATAFQNDARGRAAAARPAAPDGLDDDDDDDAVA